MTASPQLLNPSARYPWLAWGGALLCLAFAAGAGWHAWDRAQSADQGALELRRLQAMRKVPPFQPAKGEVEIQRRWDALAAERAFNWYPIFRALERSSSADIELLEFLPDKVGRRVVLRGEARTAEALTDYVAALAEEGSFDQVYLSHQKIIVRAGMSVLSFEVRAVIVKGSGNKR